MSTPFSMQQGVQNPELMYRSPALPGEMRPRLRELGYAPHATELLMQGLPIVYSQKPYLLIVEYPDGRRLHVERRKVYDPSSGAFQRYQYDILETLEPAPR